MSPHKPVSTAHAVSTPVIDYCKIGLYMARPRTQKGSVTKIRSDGRWQWLGRWRLYETVDGVERSRQRYRQLGDCDKMTKTLARETLAAIIAEEHAPPLPVIQPKPILTVSALCDAYLRARMATWEVLTQKTNKSLIKTIRAQFGEMKAEDVTKQALQEWLNELAVNRSKSYLGQITGHLRTMFSEALEEKQIDHNPSKHLMRPKTKKSSERFLSMPECYRLLAACDGRDHLILGTFLICGLRPGELFALRVKDVHLEFVDSQPEWRLRIDETLHEGRARDRTKTEESDGWVVLPESLAREVHAWIKERGIADYPDELLFQSTRGCPIHAGNYLKRDLANIAKRAKLSRVTHQVLRRTTGTHFQRHGNIKDTQGHMRHTDPETTLRHYQKVIPLSLKVAVSGWANELLVVADRTRQ